MTAVPVWEDPRVTAGLLRQLEARQVLLDAGVEHVGWKVGFGAPASLALLGISSPLLGFLTDATVVPSDGEVDVSGWERGIVEFEVAVRLGRDVDARMDPASARAAVDAVGPAIELASIDLPIGPEHVTEIVAGNIFHRAVIFGAFDPGRAGLDTSGLMARIRLDGAEVASTAELDSLTGDYAHIVSTVATTLASQGHRLRAGDVIITGSVIPPIPIRDAREFEFVLDPYEPLAVQVA